MSRKVIVEVKAKLTISIDDGMSVGKVIDEMDYSFTDTTTAATIEDTEIIFAEVIDSK
ncbi:hypothetical protein LCGC14_1383820 [marine sediment metagenome]|uniref:Uncharacterized protein n=1 Tax=marine sediment metagenome TaxID=412755 RepID=A0A0F9N3G4_9ZZZZ